MTRIEPMLDTDLVIVLVVPGGLVYLARDLTISDGSELIVEDGAEVLIL